ncbi:MAG TPA: NAD(P)-dependent oxidoreductase [Solirubrobacterales bacterium]|jgi:3-hydroxyisobutyrate dehydrogenase|nr:NAD(P)-dependent oxidoreductase [Solirubrobacterales bacterium]
MSRLAFLGTGVMGGPMARNLARAGFEVAVWNRSPEKARRLEGDRVTACDTPVEAAAGAALLVTMLADGAATAATVEGFGGALPALGEDAVWLQMGTVGVPGSERLEALADRHRVLYVDAPVVGSTPQAESGELLILASGPEAAKPPAEAAFAALGRTSWIGEAGAASRLKLVINAWFMASNAVLGETIALAEWMGVAPGHFLDTVDFGEVALPHVRASGLAMRDEEYPVSFPLRLAAKDMALALAAAGPGARSLPVLEASSAEYEEAVARGYGDGDWAEVVRVARPAAGPGDERARPDP